MTVRAEDQLEVLGRAHVGLRVVLRVLVSVRAAIGKARERDTATAVRRRRVDGHRLVEADATGVGLARLEALAIVRLKRYIAIDSQLDT